MAERASGVRLVIVVEIASERIAVEGPPALERAVAVRYAAFVCSGEATAQIRVEIVPGFCGDYAAPASLHLALDGDTLALSGAARGSLDLATGTGALEGVADLGALDAALRALVATRAPLHGALLLHGMIAPLEHRALVLVGASGSGKSTAARALDAVSDELVVVTSDGRAHATPYWGGRSFSAPLGLLGILHRGVGRMTQLHGSDAMRALAAHVVRYVPYAPAERAILVALAHLAGRSAWRIDAPVGDAFPGYIRDVVARA